MTMFGLDTNVIVRLPTNDDPQQRRAALGFAEGLGRDDTAFVSLVSMENADFADALIAARSRQEGCRSTKTFDKKAASRIPGMELLA